MLSVFLVSLAAGQSWEWAGVFATPDDSYTWIAQKATGTPKDYADPTMKLVVLSAATADGAGLENVRTKGNTAMAATCTAVSTGGEITPTDGACFTLTFDASAAETTFTIKATGVANIAFFAQHFPTEFEDTKHYFQTTAAVDVEPLATINPVSFEWMGVFATPETEYTWIAQKAKGTPKDYADPEMILVALSASAATDAAMDALVPKAKDCYAQLTCTEVTAGGTVTPAENTCYTLKFTASAAETTFKIAATGVANIAFFAQHFPTEFEDTKHYFQTTAGADVEPAAEEAVSGEGGHSHGGGSIDHGNSCGCEQDGDFKFTIDCTNTQAIRDAMTTLSTCDKATCKTTAACQTAYFVIQSHHDHCDHDTLLTAEEAAVHEWETKCTNCQIYRPYKPNNVACTFMPADSEASCADTTVTVSALAVLEEQCTKYVDASNTGTCCGDSVTIGAFATIVAYHDLCDPSDVPEAVEIAFHDYEHSCEDHFCNAVDASYDGTKCSQSAIAGMLLAVVAAVAA